MPKLHRRFRQQTSAVIQSAITCAIATTIASPAGLSSSELLTYEFKAWMVAWMTIVPFVLLATPLIRRLTSFVVQAEPPEARPMRDAD
jgi:cytochrome c oxidase assembly factor CtaG